MNIKLIGRKKELEALREYISSNRSEFVAVYGRRRVGKTFLIRQMAADNFAFYVTGMDNANMKEQLTNFGIALQRHKKSSTLSVPENWILAFYKLARYLETLPDGPKVIFIDELPWMDTPKSGFVSALENFWNSWAAVRTDVKLIVCGSATSWMINKLIKNRGGLHNRITHRMIIEPFVLNECEQYFMANGFSYSHRDIAECYMVMGGIPYYLSFMRKDRSLAQNIDRLFVESGAELSDEFENRYRALFKNAGLHIQIVTALATKAKGLNRKELLRITGLTNNGAFSIALEELESCGFIRRYEPFGKPRMNPTGRLQRDALFQLVDFYTLFYFRFIRTNRYRDEHFWTTSQNTPLHASWSGYAFEMLCLDHVRQIKAALGIAGVQTLVCSWSSSTVDKGAQIDLVIDRKDETANLCEMKYYSTVFAIDKGYEEKLRNKIAAFREETNTRKSLMLTFVTTYGLKENMYSGCVQSQVLLDDLFKE